MDQLGHRLSYTYDVAGRLQSMTNELNAMVVLYEYDAAGRIARKTAGNGMLSTYQYNPAGQVLNLTHSLANNAAISWFNYTYDSRGRRTTMSTVDGNWTYTYDDLGQLIHAVFASTSTIPNQDLTYVYDAVGNRTHAIENGVAISYAMNKLNQYFSVGQTNYTFDADGNLIREVWPQGTNTYAYNYENRLTEVVSSQGTWQNAYDGLGNRVSSNENGVGTRFVVDPIGLGNVVGEYGASGDIIAHYDHGAGLLSRIDALGRPAFYNFEAIGNVRQLVAGTPTIENSYSYAPFGLTLSKTEGIANQFQFIGEFGVTRQRSGLYLMGARHYASDTGRFTSPDPLGQYGSGPNLYAYGANDPIFRIDPSGLMSFGQCMDQCWAMTGRIYGWQLTSVCTAAGALCKLGNPYACVLATFCLSFNAGRVLDCYGYCASHSGLPECPQRPTVGTYVPHVGWRPVVPYPPTHPGGDGTTGVTRPTDPNQLTGPAGFGPNGFLSSANALAYRIDFENYTNASAPAQQVIITDQLSTNYDWTTFNVGEVGFGDWLVALPPGTQHYETNLAMSYLGTNFQVQIQIGISLVSGQVYANFRSIDPATSLPPPVNIGFLPPEDGTGRGQGHVTYTVRARPGLPTGTQLRNVALISFDNQPAISTDQVDPLDPAKGIDATKQALITLDTVAPTSHVNSLPAQSQLLQVPVSWTGQDDFGGSGVASYDVYVSDNGGAWALWQSASASTNATFQGKPQHTYGFKSVARDNAGNLEAAHAAADATTKVVANPMFQLTVTPASTNLNVDDTYAFTIKVKNVGSLSLNGVVLSNAIPAGVALDWVQYGRGSCDIGDDWILWSLGTMNTNVSATMSVTATAAANGLWTNLFTVADADGAAAATATQLIQIGSVAAPMLSVGLTNQQVVLSWAQSASGYHLETTANLASSTNWSAVTNIPVPVSDQSTVTLPASARPSFFRLRSP
jgi:RHS repeat-associated protein/uncharacterized repeat protein (TIGR01451 family)